jgi:hypothetical protein
MPLFAFFASWVINLNTDKWYTFKNSLLAQNYWSYWAQYPFVFCAGNNSWYWFGNGTQWCRNMATDQWSVLGVSTYRTGEIQFTLEWDQPVDLDLEVQVGSETIYWGHDVGTGDANYGRLDKDNQGTRDSAGRFVENIYWPQGTAPQPTVGSLYRTIQPRVKEPLAKLLSELLQESIQESGFSSQNFAMRWLGIGSVVVHSES